jgi:hypothetical protein
MRALERAQAEAVIAWAGQRRVAPETIHWSIPDPASEPGTNAWLVSTRTAIRTCCRS